ncbi:alkylation response protein AidB-like acyl-CoA dehydrogenase [Rhodothalassium salexigens DSM 2132]|uniref:Alkylation response protein AidB-like acyl-CoA dehydrogenase n=1 Tax=Rhodothalassium salexigens DSM 2132 TaxID=1188247 RepID=A0A4R2PUQ7_RHOSA|nr:acyl-CoA dehydrogenase family protein [Rhodothalassium salexigens]MBB4210542.1 alkylation response protein AidB-like acyl-CoA dehydrogenase [Rhodothalassium salexigens DSM 2132]MBK1638049.1 pimeloyl-CoA dehydrogenase small subunit [Rhodothalassium salexigens DSM 2132]TCP37901.1 alkylation response protein AidB-like acyl-CoA dehydrogenase [Rhodothalassium salexigens DSM 2132]
MDFQYSEEQRLLADSAARFVRERYDFETRQRIAMGEAGFSAEHWAQMADQGWLALPFAEADGGLGAGPVEMMIVMEALGRGLVVEPYLPTVVLAGGVVAACGNADQRAALLPAIATGELKAAFAHAEAAARYSPAFTACEARPAEGGGYVLTGAKSVVLGAPLADRLVVLARTGRKPGTAQGLSLFLVDPAADGVVVRGYPTTDGQRAGDVLLDGVRVGADAMLGPRGQGLAVAERVLDAATAMLCAEALGAMDAAVAMTREHLRTRTQFGRPIGDFQVLQHRLVDMTIAAEEARSLTIRAALMLDADEAERRAAVSAAKVTVGDRGRFIAAQAVQLHGGMGVSDDMAVGHYFKRLYMVEQLFGDSAYHRDRWHALQ